MELLLISVIVNHLCLFEALQNTQHGFVRKCSRLTSIVPTDEMITTIMDWDGDVDLVFLDFAK